MLSPTIGQPLDAQWTRSWWVRPVTGVRASQVSLRCRSGERAPASDRPPLKGKRSTAEAVAGGPVPDPSASLTLACVACGGGLERTGKERAGEAVYARALSAPVAPPARPDPASGPQKAVARSGQGDDRPRTFQVVTEGSPFGSGFIHQPRVSSSRPRDNSTVPSSASGPPSTTAQ
jgi:hypothetical protein